MLNKLADATMKFTNLFMYKTTGRNNVKNASLKPIDISAEYSNIAQKVNIKWVKRYYPRKQQ